MVGNFFLIEMKNKKENIFLCGFMASGKSTIGPILANVLGYGFIDLDKYILKIKGKTVRQIFEDEGESQFRIYEEEIISEISKLKNIVVALGGGSIRSKNILSLIKQNGILIYLKTNPESLSKRLRNKTDRPLILNDKNEKLSPDELLTRIDELISKRKKYYEMADLEIETDKTPVGKTVDTIIKELKHI